MIRRDTERKHTYSDLVFKEMNIFDIQGLLIEKDEFTCCIEAYEVKDFHDINWSLLSPAELNAKSIFSRNLKIPFKIIISCKYAKMFRIYNVKAGIVETNYIEKNENNFLKWWASYQSFNQKKPMYDANARIKNSYIDNLLFSNNLAWGINVDGFSIINNIVNIVFEKRIRTAKLKYNIETYDPNTYFKGTYSRAGDYASWIRLYKLKSKLNSKLILLTFDTSPNYYVGASEIINVDRNGLIYKNNLKPFENIFKNKLKNLEKYIYE